MRRYVVSVRETRDVQYIVLAEDEETARGMYDRLEVEAPKFPSRINYDIQDITEIPIGSA